MSTCSQKPATADPGETLNTSGTTTATIPGSVFDSGRTRLLTGKSSTTSEPSAHHPRTKRAHAAVIVVGTDDPVTAERDVALIQLAGRHV